VPGDAAQQALTMVAAVRHDPVLRLQLASSFYDDQPHRASIRPYRRAELAFMRWQLRRGVLASPQSPRPGSQWWRSVNESLLRDACEAHWLAAGRSGPASTPAVVRWVDFLGNPCARTWYRAHNASVVAGYLEHRHLSAAELPAERFFMDLTLARLLCVHALVVKPRLALGRRLTAVGRLVADPRWRGADLFLSLQNIWPTQYPLTGRSIDEILKAASYAGHLIDDAVILPRMQTLYAFAASDLNLPRLLDLIRDGYPTYAWAYEDRHAWTTAPAWTARSLLSWLTAPTG